MNKRKTINSTDRSFASRSSNYTDGKIFSACGRYIYHVSIIDYLQKYNLQKKLERLAKESVRKMTCQNCSKQSDSNNDLSVVNPAKYRKRFLKFCRREVFANIEV